MVSSRRGRVASAAATLAVLLALAGFTPGVAVARAAAPRRAAAASRLTLELPLRIDARGLAAFATAVSMPGSPLYRRYEPVPELARRFGASAATRIRVLRYLRLAGASGVRIDPTGLFADATLPAARAERLFRTSLAWARAPAGSDVAGGRASYLAPRSRVRVPAALAGAVTGVVGLDTRPLAGFSDTTDAAPRASGYTPRSGTPSGCPAALADPGFTPNEYLSAYGYGPLQAAGLDGQGERVALIEIDGFTPSDVSSFASCFGLPVPPIHAFGVGIGKALPAGGEATLDLELLDATAPRLSDIDVYESEPIAADVLRSLTEPLAVRGRKPNVISASLGACEADTQAAIGSAGIRTVESALQLAAATGVSVLASSGDDGSSGCLTAKGNPLDLLAVSFPASSPWVTGVGGTNATLDPANTIADPATDQVVWNDEPQSVGAGGGGISTFDRPSYQAGFVTGAKREVPDVSMLADPIPGYDIYCTATTDCVTTPGASPWVTIGGTSASTPLLAGGLALIDEQLAGHGQQPLGFVNPLLYEVARSSTAASTFADVVSGSNDLGPSIFGRPLGCCTATTGYDDASGLGSVNVSGLASAAAALVPKAVTVGLRLPSQSAPLRVEHLLATVSCSNTCLMGAYARIAIGHGAVIAAYSRPYETTGARSRTIPIGLSGSARARIRSALAAGTSVTATVYGAIVDASGAIERRTAGRTLRITG